MKKVKLSTTKETAKNVPRHAEPASVLPLENGGAEFEQHALDNGFSKGALNIFVFISCGLFIAFAVGLLMNPLGIQRHIFIMGMADMFADFLNLLRYIAERDPYFNTRGDYCEKIYPPMIYMILYPFSQLDNFSTMLWRNIFNSRMAVMSCFAFTGFSVYLLLIAMSQIMKKYSVPFIMLISLCLSYVFVFSVERANVVILSAACVGFFICNYDSADKRKRIWAAISLAVAVTLKIYPILFGFLYLAKKQYREMFFCALVTLLLVFVPYFFFKGGFADIPQHISNMLSFNVAYGATKIGPKFGLPALLYCYLEALHFPDETVLTLLSAAKIINAMACIIAIIFSCLIENRWLRISLLTMAVLFLPAASHFYCGLYMFPMIILFFPTMRERTKIFNVFTIIVFIVFLNPFQIAFLEGKGITTTVNFLVFNIFLLSWFLVLLISSGRQIAMNYIASISPKRTLFNKGA
jgi:hypothetical protein